MPRFDIRLRGQAIFKDNKIVAKAAGRVLKPAS
jgi:hypothetical protein